MLGTLQFTFYSCCRILSYKFFCTARDFDVTGKSNTAVRVNFFMLWWAAVLFIVLVTARKLDVSIVNTKTSTWWTKTKDRHRTHWKVGCNTVLVLGGIEIIFFTAASMGLCFGFVLETVLITQGCFSSCWAGLRELRPFLPLTPPQQQAGGGGGGHKGLGGEMAGTADPNWPKGCPTPYGVRLSI